MAKASRPASRKPGKRRSPAKPANSRKKHGLLADLGVLRLGLAVLAILNLLLAPKSGTAAVFSGWEVIPTLIVPVMAPIIFMVLMLDALMGRVLMGSASGTERVRYRRITLVNLLLGAALLAYWVPYFAVLARSG